MQDVFVQQTTLTVPASHAEHGDDYVIEWQDPVICLLYTSWNKLWPFGLRHGRVCSKPAVWQLWFKVAVSYTHLDVYKRQVFWKRSAAVCTRPICAPLTCALPWKQPG